MSKEIGSDSECTPGETPRSVEEISRQVRRLPPHDPLNAKGTQSFAAEEHAIVEYFTGSASKAAELQRLAIDVLPSTNTGGRGQKLAQLAIYLASAGRLEEAEDAYSSSVPLLAAWSTKRDRVKTNVYSYLRPDFFGARGRAAIVEAKGNLQEAEVYNRKALEILEKARKSDIFVFVRGNPISHVRAILARVLLLQGRLVEAEATARKAATEMSVTGRNVDSLSDAGIATLLSQIFLEQGRFDDSAEMARAAIARSGRGKGHAWISCASLSLNRARLALANALGGQGSWGRSPPTV